MNYFSLFKLPICYQIDKQQLMSAFRNLQRKYHPDKFSNLSKSEQLIALKNSSNINQAWRILNDPINRAEYLLSLKGFKFKENNTISDLDFLTEQIALNEELNCIQFKKDIMKLKIFIEKTNNLINNWYIKMVEQLDNDNLDNAYDILIKIKFFNKLNNNANKIEQKLIDF